MRIARQDTFSRLIVPAVLACIIGASTLVATWSGGPATPLRFDGMPGVSGGATERQPSGTDDAITRLQQHIRRTPDDVDAYTHLANAYLQRARETGDTSYYGKVDSVLAGALNRDPDNVEALIAKGALALARHDFRAGLALGEQARQINPTIPRVYGVIADAQIELGRYDEAVATVQRMVDMRPDLSSYSRVSYLRELHGDLPGAIEAMELAVDAGGPRAENTQWARVQLGNLHWTTGNLEAAEREYRLAINALPGYVPAMAGRARIAAARGDYDTAVVLLEEAARRMPLPEYIIALGDVYAKRGDLPNAQRQYDLVEAIDPLFTANGVNTDLEMALFFADHGLKRDESLKKARAAYAVRPSVHAAGSLAWTLYKLGQHEEAARYMREALRLGTADPLMLFHAGMIAHARGEHEPARDYLERALALNPHFSLRYDDVAAKTLARIEQHTTGGKQ